MSVTFSLQGYLLDAVGIRRYPVDIYENEICGLNPEIYSGKCKKLRNCMNLLEEKKDIEVCSFGSSNRGDDTLVCCSRDDFYKSRKQTRDGILDYDICANKYKNLRMTESSTFEAFAINGVDVAPYEFSHIAAIGWIQLLDFSISWNCAGNLITETFVMSAAHCMLLDGRKPNIVRLGDVDLNSEEDNHHIQQFYVYRTIKHPDYNYDTNENDIALIQLRGQVNPTMNVVPACLNSGVIKTEYFEGAGYGQAENHLRSNRLSKVHLKLVEMQTCQNSYDLPLSADAQICALGYREDLPPQDLCYGDSGSALQYMSSDLVEDQTIYKIPTLIGITSFGIGCAFGFPSVYVNISHYLGWMESIISP